MFVLKRNSYFYAKNTLTVGHTTSMKHIFNFSNNLLLLVCLFLCACHQELEYSQGKEYKTSVFAIPSYMPRRIVRLIESLRRDEHKTHLEETLALRGIKVLWPHLILLADGDTDSVALVPIYDPAYPNEIRCIWRFDLKEDGRYKQSFLYRDKFPPADRWGFDYLTVHALGKAAPRGVYFKDSQRNYARLSLYHCVYYGVGGVDDQGKEHISWRERCWSEYITMPIPVYPDDNTNGGGAGGGAEPDNSGGGGDYGFSNEQLNSLRECFDKIDKKASFKSSRASSIYDKLAKCSKLIQMIQKYFEGRHAIGNLILSVAPIKNVESNQISHGVTYAPSAEVGDEKPGPNNIEVRINPETIDDLTEEGLTAVLMHEMLHANLLAKCYLSQVRMV